MRYQVPQFTEVESKIFGPLTLKQFIYLVGGGGMIFLLYISFPFWLTLLFGMPIGALAVALAFYKHNNLPFVKVIENALGYFSGSRLYLWKKVATKETSVESAGRQAGEQVPIYIPKLTKSKLKDLAWSLDVKEKIK